MALTHSEPGTSSASGVAGPQREEAGFEPEPVVRVLPEPERADLSREEVAKRLEEAGLVETAELARRSA